MQLLAYPDLHVGYELAYTTSPSLSKAVTGYNLQCWQPGHYWHAQFSLAIARSYARYFEH